MQLDRAVSLRRSLQLMEMENSELNPAAHTALSRSQPSRRPNQTVRAGWGFQLSGARKYCRCPALRKYEKVKDAKPNQSHGSRDRTPKGVRKTSLARRHAIVCTH